MNSIPVSVNSLGNTVVVTGSIGVSIVIRALTLQANALTTITFKAGTSSLSGPMTFLAGGSLHVGNAGDTIWDLGVNTDFIVNLTGLTGNVAGWLIYDTY